MARNLALLPIYPCSPTGEERIAYHQLGWCGRLDFESQLIVSGVVAEHVCGCRAYDRRRSRLDNTRVGQRLLQLGDGLLGEAGEAEQVRHVARILAAHADLHSAAVQCYAFEMA